MTRISFICGALVFLSFAIAACIDSNRFIRQHTETDSEFQKHQAPLSFLVIVAVLLIVSLFLR